MKLTMPMAVFGGLALIAAAIYFGSGSAPVNAAGGVQKVQICDEDGDCANVTGGEFWVNATRSKLRLLE